MDPNSSTYIFIDAGYLRQVMEQALVPFVGAPLGIRWESLLVTFSGKRAFYYDCLDELPRQGESDSELQERLQGQSRLIDEINAAPGLFVRLGSLRGDARRRRQKEIDVLLAVDMLTHSHNRNMSRAVLIAGDLDFKPVVEALVMQGTLVTVVSDLRSTSRDLANAADRHEPLSLRTLWRISSGPHDVATSKLLPSEFAYAQDPKSAPVQSGLLEGKPVHLYNEGAHWKAVLPVTRTVMMSTRWQHNDREKLLEFLRLEFGSIQWNP